MDARVAVLEEIAKNTKDTLGDMRAEMRGVRTDMRGDAQEWRADNKAHRDRQERDFRILFGAIITTTLGLAALIARGFHWF